ncbi:hypothetical protein FXF51_08490 [Nonomuraea sp. PA05]|uniref:hypothetical protein n=1 Tax=Nonomuraea sp. PA05 TaxID=2604466 RepID=UPI0011D59F53|nr:hypothetical protein [Nonomuraea sp. PA05]TYB69258.1 hypothetical protein FXF51_08490 [Nonomuraea sp. PA05]
MTGRTAIVIGAGPVVASALTRAGAAVVLATCPDAAHADATCPHAACPHAACPHAACPHATRPVAAPGAAPVAVPVDVRDPASVRRLVEQTLGAFGRLDLAVNHVQPRDLPTAIRYQASAMRRTGGGHIVNLAPDTASRTAVSELTRTAAREHADVQINAVAPHVSPADVADAVMCLCSGDSPLATGETCHLPQSLCTLPPYRT